MLTLKNHKKTLINQLCYNKRYILLYYKEATLKSNPPFPHPKRIIVVYQ